MNAAENMIVADYIDRLPPETTMGFVFADLFNNVSQLADSLREPVELDDDISLRTTEGFSSDDDSDPETAITYRVITAGWLFRQGRNLVGLSQEGPAGEEATPADTPRAVYAYRNRPMPVISYEISKFDYHVSVHLADVPQDKEMAELYDHEKPYADYVKHDLETPVGELDDHDRKQLRLVTNAIELGVVRAELLAAGDADAFYKMFRTNPPQTTPHFSLRRLLSRHVIGLDNLA